MCQLHLGQVVGGRPRIDAYEEMQQLGAFGSVSHRLLFDLTAEEVQRFPPLLGDRRRLVADDVWDLVQALFEEKGAAMTVGVLAQTADAASMGRYLRRCVRNFLIDRARRTPTGAVRRKVEELLSASPEFAQAPPGSPGAGRWQRAGELWPVYGRELSPLVAAAYAVPGVRAVRWSGSRRAPLASDKDLTAILSAVLATAGGSLEVAQLVAVLVRRFPAAVEPADARLDEQTFDRVTAPVDDPMTERSGEVGDRAREVYAQLSPAQRALLPHVTDPIADQMQILRAGRSQTYVAVRTLRTMLADLIPEDEWRDTVFHELVQLCGGSS